MAAERKPRPIRRRGLSGRALGPESLLFGGRGEADPESAEVEHSPLPAKQTPRFHAYEDEYASPAEIDDEGASGHPDLRSLLPPADKERNLDDWGRSEHFISTIEPALNFYYRYWFRVETEGIENIPSEGGALLVSNHSGALPPDAPMVMQAIRNEHPSPRPLYMFGEDWFKGYPGVSMLVNKLGLVPAQRDNAQRLLYDEGRLAIVFPEGLKGSRKVYWQRYRLRRFGRGGFVRTAIRARVPIVPLALVGGEEAMPIFAHMKTMEKLTGLIYFPLTPAFPHLGLAASLMYLPAKFKIRFLEPIDTSIYPVEVADDPAEVQTIAEEIRTRIQLQLDQMLVQRKSVWFG